MKQDDYLLMDKYLANELNETEKTAFENRLNSDLDFKDEFTVYKEIHNTLKNRIENSDKQSELIKTLSGLNKKFIKKPEKKTKVINLSLYAKYFVAASLVIFFSVLWFNDGKPKYSDYNNFNNIELTVRGNNTEELIKAENAFNTKNYTEAENVFKKLVSKNPDNTAYRLYLALSLMEEDKLPEAEKILIEIKAGNSIYKNKALWYLALLELKKKDYSASKKYLQQIPDDAVEYSTAKKLIKRL